MKGAAAGQTAAMWLVLLLAPCERGGATEGMGHAGRSSCRCV